MASSSTTYGTDESRTSIEEASQELLFHPLSTSSDAAGATTAGVSEEELRWLRDCLPVFVHPKVDVIKYRNDLCKVFFRFERHEDSPQQLNCLLCIVYKGESSYNVKRETKENKLATLCYRSFNRRTYKRTADIDYMEFRDIDLRPNHPKPWKSLFSIDHAGDQSWSKGAKANIWTWFSLMHHYSVDVPYADWQIEPGTHRPHVFLNTCNHLIGEKDNNGSMEKHFWREYPFEYGDNQDAFEYVVHHVPTKFNLYSYVCFWKAKNGGKWCDRSRTGKLTRSGKSIYMDIRKQEASIQKDVASPSPQ